MKIVCFGDSLTYGNIGYSYRKHIDSNYHIVNKGINGDTTIHVYARLKKYIENNIHKDDDVYIIEVGTNDLLLPYITTISSLWKVQTAPRVLTMKCILDDELFEIEFEKFFILLNEHNKPGIIMGIPICQLINFPNEIAQKRNNIMKKLADKYHMPFVDTAAIQRQIAPNFSVTHSWKHKNFMRVIDAIIMSIFPFSKNLFSRARRLNLTVDGVHFNYLSAQSIGEVVTESLNKML